VLRNRVSWTCAAVWVACAAPGGPGPWQSWQSAHDREHPLTGRVIDVAARASLTPDALLARLAGADFVLLGEKHDNPDHHRLQAWIIDGLARSGRRAVGFEMLSLDLAPALATQLDAAPHDVDGIGRAVDWEGRGWPAWPLYRPVFQAALAADLPIFPADLDRQMLARLRAGGAPPEVLRSLGLDRPLAPEDRDALGSELLRAHCGSLPEHAVERVIAIQRARDAQLAAALAAAGRSEGAVLIAGAGHVGKRWGVPVYLERAAPDARTASVSFQEVDPAMRELPALLASEPPFDYLWMTPRVEDGDPCDRYREQLRRLHRAPHGGAPHG
jgi:uncharacterized iron-regulated protein